MSRPVLHLSLAVGLCAAAAGALCTGLYLVEGVLARLGEPDQSLLFWYLPFLFGGLVLLAAGAAVTAWAWRNLRRPPPAVSSGSARHR